MEGVFTVKDPIVHEKENHSIDGQQSHSNEQEVIEKAVKMYDSRKYSLLEILEVTGLSKSVLYPHIQSRN